MSRENRWQWVFAYFKNASSRKAARSLGGETVTWGSENTTSKTLTNLPHIRIGSGWGGTMNYQAAIWYNVDDTLVDAAVRQMSCSLKPHSQRSVIRSSLVYYQPLVDAANENNATTGNVFVGDSMTAANLTFGWPLAYSSPSLESGLSLLTFDEPHHILPERFRFRWPTTGPLPDFRMVKVVSGFLALAGASDANAIGATAPPENQWEPPYQHSTNYLTAYQPVSKFTDPHIRVEIAAANTITAGGEVFQAAWQKLRRVKLRKAVPSKTEFKMEIVRLKV